MSRKNGKADEPTQERKKVTEESLRYIQAIIFPEMPCKAGILFIVIMASNPKQRDPVHLREVERLHEMSVETSWTGTENRYLEGLQAGIPDMGFLG